MDNLYKQREIRGFCHLYDGQVRHELDKLLVENKEEKNYSEGGYRYHSKNNTIICSKKEIKNLDKYCFMIRVEILREWGEIYCMVTTFLFFRKLFALVLKRLAIWMIV